MTTPLPKANRPSTGGPNPFVLLGLAVLGSFTFYALIQRKKNDPREKERGKMRASTSFPRRWSSDEEKEKAQTR